MHPYIWQVQSQNQTVYSKYSKYFCILGLCVFLKGQDVSFIGVFLTT